MPITRQQTDLLLADLESRIRQLEDGWRDRTLFARKLEYDLRPILDTAADPAHVREWVQAMLLRIDAAAQPFGLGTATERSGPGQVAA